MQNIVLDTNSLIMSLSSKNDYRMIWKAFLDGEYMLCVTNEIIEEYMEVLARNINIRVAETIVYTILNRKNVHRLDPHFRFHLIEADQDDNKFVDCAIAANAKYIVTEDHHFNVLKKIEFPKLNVVNIDEFLKILQDIKWYLTEWRMKTGGSEDCLPFFIR